MDKPLLLKPDEVAHALGVGRARVYQLTMQGLPYVQMGKSIRVPAEALAEWVRSKTKPASETTTSDHEEQQQTA